MRSYYLLLLLLPLASACVSDPVEEEEELCSDGTPLSQFNCKIGFSEWRIASVSSDVARPHADGPTRDWTAFQQECYRSSFFELSGFGPTTDTGMIVGIPSVENEATNCADDVGNLISTDLDFRDAEVLFGEEHSLFFYGIPFPDNAAQEETWYDIRYQTNEFLRFRVDKTLDGVDYRVSVEMVPAGG